MIKFEEIDENAQKGQKKPLRTGVSTGEKVKCTIMAVPMGTRTHVFDC